MKAFLPAYGSEMLTFALKAAKRYGPRIAAVINPDSGPGDAAVDTKQLNAHRALVAAHAESWLYMDFVTGPQYSPFITAAGKLETPREPRNKTTAELDRELARYTKQGFTTATGIFCDDTTSKQHRDLINNSKLRGRACIPNPGNWNDSRKFADLAPMTGGGLCIFETTGWLQKAPKLEEPFTDADGIVVLALRCSAKDYDLAARKAHELGARYFYATDQPRPWDKPATYADDLLKLITTL